MAEGPRHPEGWYPDPGDSRMERWWDGERWTERIRPAGPPPPPTGQAPWGRQEPGGGQWADPPPTWGRQGQWGQRPTAGWQPAGPPPPNHLVWAILTTVLCCLPFGIVSIVKAAQVSSRWAAGDVDGAREASASARTWAIVSAVTAVGLWVVMFAAIVLLGAASTTSHDIDDVHIEGEMCFDDPTRC